MEDDWGEALKLTKIEAKGGGGRIPRIIHLTQIEKELSKVKGRNKDFGS